MSFPQSRGVCWIFLREVLCALDGRTWVNSAHDKLTGDNEALTPLAVCAAGASG